jgi:hypothetical protein
MAAVPADVFVGGGEDVESRFDLEEPDGAELSLLDAAFAEPDFLVHGAVAALVSEDVDGYGAGCRAGDSVSDFCASAGEDIRGLVFAGFTDVDFFDGELHVF